MILNVFDAMRPPGYREYTREEVVWVNNHLEFDGITVFTDLTLDWADKVESKQKIAWIQECREIHPQTYESLPEVEHLFDYIFTFDDELLSEGPKYIKNLIASSRVSDDDAGLCRKSKMLSLIASKKNWTYGHKLRHIVAHYIRMADQVLYDVDLWGEAYRPWGDPTIATGAAQQQGKTEPLKEYYFSIVIMNSQQDNYFTEALIDAFRLGTIPIFWGCKNIGEYFNTDGILTFETKGDLFRVLDTLSQAEYYRRFPAVKENYEIAKNYMSMDDTFVRNLRRVLKNEI